MKETFEKLSWVSVTTNVAMALFGMYALWLVSIGMSAPRWTPEWTSALAAALALPVAAGTALFAVLGAFALWRRQQRARSMQMRAVGIAMFDELYHRLLELEVFTNYERWREFYKNVHGQEPKASTARKRHKAAGARYIASLTNETEMAIANFAVLRDNLGDLDPGQVEAVLRLNTFLCGMPIQLRKMATSWNKRSALTKPVALTADMQRLLGLGIGACGYFLHKLDGKIRSLERAREYEAFFLQQQAIHNAQRVA